MESERIKNQRTVKIKWIMNDRSLGIGMAWMKILREAGSEFTDEEYNDELGLMN